MLSMLTCVWLSELSNLKLRQKGGCMATSDHKILTISSRIKAWYSNWFITSWQLDIFQVNISSFHSIYMYIYLLFMQVRLTSFFTYLKLWNYTRKKSRNPEKLKFIVALPLERHIIINFIVALMHLLDSLALFSVINCVDTLLLHLRHSIVLVPLEKWLSVPIISQLCLWFSFCF